MSRDMAKSKSNKKMLQLTDENYYSNKANQEYLSVSQYKSFMQCEARAYAELNGEYERENTVALLIGSYVDVMLTGTEEEQQEFVRNHPEMYSSRGDTKGQLKMAFKHADVMIERVKRDKLFMKTLDGKHQEIMTGEIDGVPFKIKIDSLLENAIVDLKTTKSITESYWNPESGQRETFVEYFGYTTQGAVYQEIVRQNTGKKLPFYLSAVSKETEPDIEVIQIDNETLEDALESVKRNARNIQDIKDGLLEPIPCGKCDYCKSKKVLKAPIMWTEVGGELS